MVEVIRAALATSNLPWDFLGIRTTLGKEKAPAIAYSIGGGTVNPDKCTVNSQYPGIVIIIYIPVTIPEYWLFGLKPVIFYRQHCRTTDYNVLMVSVTTILAISIMPRSILKLYTACYAVGTGFDSQERYQDLFLDGGTCSESRIKA